MQIHAKGAIASAFRYFRNFRQSQAGNIGIMFGLSAIPIFLAAGSAIDYSRIANAKSNLVAGLDSAALYAAAITDKTESQMTGLARDYLNQNFGSTTDATITAFTLKNFADHVEVKGTVKVKTWFMSVGGITNIDVNGSSEIAKSGTNIEVSLALDVTGSMAGSKLTNLKKAANDFVDTVVASPDAPYYAKVAIVPYSENVQMGSYANAAGGKLISGTCNVPGCEIFNVIRDVKYPASNCAVERMGSERYTDAPASENRIGRLYHYDYSFCNGLRQIVPLTNDKNLLHNTINSLEAVPEASTAGQIGIAWGWYTLSPTFGIWTGNSVPAPYTNLGEKLKKISVIMTDGNNNRSYCSNNLVVYWGCNPPGANGDPTDQALQLCTNMKAKGITVYVIGFEVSDAKAENFVKTCVSDGSKYFDADNENELKTAFAEIAKSLLQLRISQ